MVEASLEDVFPGLRGQSYQITSPKDPRYNCIAFAAGDVRNWWWPDAAGEDTWPAGALRTETIDAFRDAFATLGYIVCDDDRLEPGYEKVALLAGCVLRDAGQGESCPAAVGSASLARATTSSIRFTT